MTNTDVESYHDALRRYDADPSKKNAELLENARKVYEVEKERRLLEANNQIASRMSALQSEFNDEVRSRVKTVKTDKVSRVKDLLRRTKEEYDLAVLQNRALRDAIDANVEHKRVLRETLDGLRAYKKELLGTKPKPKRR